MHNVELKAELRDMLMARAVCRAIGASHILTFGQTDTYYRIPQGRLKRRETEGEPAEYIFYERPNRASAKLSNFTIFTEQQAMERFGREPMPVWAIVRKKRELWMWGSVRIHLDTVDKLGMFIEFESLVSRQNNIARGHDHITTLRGHFGPAMGELIDCSYSDLLVRDIDNQLAPGQPLLPPGG